MKDGCYVFVVGLNGAHYPLALYPNRIEAFLKEAEEHAKRIYFVAKVDNIDEDIRWMSKEVPGPDWDMNLERILDDDPMVVLIENLKDEQARRCVYGTRQGDGKTCDCKYNPLAGDMSSRGKYNGCPELRQAIRILEHDLATA